MTLIDKINESKYIRPVTNALVGGSLIALLSSVAVDKADAKTITIDETVKIELVDNRMTQADASRVYNYAKNFLYEQCRYYAAIGSFQNIIDYYGKNMVDDCLYWIGKCNFEGVSMRSAYESFAKIIYMYPDGDVMQTKLLQKTLVDMIEGLSLHNSNYWRLDNNSNIKSIDDKIKLDRLFDLLDKSEAVSKDVRLRNNIKDIIEATIDSRFFGCDPNNNSDMNLKENIGQNITRFELIKDLIIYGKKTKMDISLIGDPLFNEVKRYVDRNNFYNAVHYAKLLEYVGCNQLFENAKQKIDLMLNANDIVFKNTYYKRWCGNYDDKWYEMSDSEKERHITKLVERKIREDYKGSISEEIKKGLSGEVTSYFKFFNLTQNDLDYIISKMQMEFDVSKFKATDGRPRELIADFSVKCTINIREIVEYKVGDPYSWVKIELSK